MSKSYRLVSWNVNGIRACIKKGFWDTVHDQLQPTVLGIQETKSDDKVMETGVLDNDHFQVHWHSHQEKKGYSGVALLSQQEPLRFFTGFGVEKFDVEGRVVGAEYPEFTVMNIYFPNGGQGPHRVQYKLDFYDACLDFMQTLRKSKPVVVMGDYNTAHQPIDLHDPDSNHKTTGFLPEERAWLDKLVEQDYIDTFRHCHPERADVYTWWDMRTRSRSRNKGWRIDYFWVSPELKPHIKSAEIHDDILGSDHCPLSLELDFS